MAKKKSFAKLTQRELNDILEAARDAMEILQNKKLSSSYVMLGNEAMRALEAAIKNYDKLGRSAIYEAERQAALLQHFNDIAAAMDAQTDAAIKLLDSIKYETAALGYNGSMALANNAGMWLGGVNPLQTAEWAALQKVSIEKLVRDNRLHNYNNQQKEKIATLLYEGFAAGKDSQQLALELQEILNSSYYKARTTMRTERGKVYGDGQMMAADYAESQGLDPNKTWYSNRDASVRHSHASLDGQTKPKDEPFIASSGNSAMAPCQFGIASEDVNCRCRMHLTFNRLTKQMYNAGGKDFETRNQWADAYRDMGVPVDGFVNEPEPSRRAQQVDQYERWRRARK